MNFKSPTKFRYQDQVRIISGFYATLHGYIEDYKDYYTVDHTNYFINDPDPIWVYTVDIGQRMVQIREDNLEFIKHTYEPEAKIAK